MPEQESTVNMIARYTYIPMIIGLMICPTLAYEISVHEFPRSSIMLRGFPLPWNGDDPLGSGPPLDIFILPALIDLTVYIVICRLLWKRLFPRLRSAHGAVRVPVITAVWLYGGYSLLFIALGFFVFRGSAMLWYPTHLYESLVGVGLNIGL